jgi:hypothetical protein
MTLDNDRLPALKELVLTTGICTRVLESTPHMDKILHRMKCTFIGRNFLAMLIIFCILVHCSFVNQADQPIQTP